MTFMSTEIKLWELLQSLPAMPAALRYRICGCETMFKQIYDSLAAQARGELFISYHKYDNLQRRVQLTKE